MFMRSIASPVRSKKIFALCVALVGVVASAISIPASADTLSDIMAKGKIEVATEMQFPPFDMKDNGNYVGFDRDLIDAVAKEMGVKPDYIDLPWSSVLPGLDAKKFDYVISPVTITKERLTRFAFTVPISDSTTTLVKRRGDNSITKPTDIFGKTVGALKADASVVQLNDFAAKNGGKVSIREYADTIQSTNDLAAGRLDGVIGSYPVMAYLVSKRSDDLALVQPPFGVPQYLSWVGRKDAADASLTAKINEILVKLQQNGTLATIQKKWLGAVTKLPTTVPVPAN